jgi:hypothetical protein
MKYLVKVLKIICINGGCQHLFYIDDPNTSHIYPTCIKCGSSWTEKNTQKPIELPSQNQKGID